MKKIFAIALVLFIGTTVSFAQTTTTTNATENVVKATPVVNAADMVPVAKCTTGGSCCHGASKASAILDSTTGSATDMAAPETNTVGVGTTEAPAPACHSTSMSMSAAKVEPAPAPAEDPEK